MKEDTYEGIGCMVFLFEIITDLFGGLFIFLKLIGEIEWSWWLVTLPLWGPWLIYLLLILILSVILIK